MEKIQLKGNIWYTGSYVFIEKFDPSIKNFVEINLDEFLRDNVKENSKITITIESDDSKHKEVNMKKREPYIRNKIKLKDVLLNKTEVSDLVIFKDSAGYYIGCTIIDHEDLFINSLNPELLDKKVKDYYYEEQNIYNTRKVMIVNLRY